MPLYDHLCLSLLSVSTSLWISMPISISTSYLYLSISLCIYIYKFISRNWLVRLWGLARLGSAARAGSLEARHGAEAAASGQSFFLRGEPSVLFFVLPRVGRGPTPVGEDGPPHAQSATGAARRVRGGRPQRLPISVYQTSWGCSQAKGTQDTGHRTCPGQRV